MDKEIYKSKTVQGVVVATVGGLWGAWAGVEPVSSTVALLGFGWAGYGLRDSLD